MPKAKKFINKKKAVTFQLVHRSQQDPLIADEDAPQRVLQPVQKETAEERAKRIEEQHKYGIYYTDDTNYLEFLRERSDFRVEWPEHVEKEIEEKKKRFDLPSEVFASKKEEKVGLLNKAMPVSELLDDMDPDVLAAMDDDFNYDDPDNQLEDDFIELADGFVADSDGIDVKMIGDEGCETENSDDDSCETETLDDDSCESELLDYDSCEAETQDNDRCETKFSYSKDPKEAHQQMLSKQFHRMLKLFDEASQNLDEEEEVRDRTEAETEEILRFGEEFEQSKQLHKLDKDDRANAITKEMAKRKNAFKTTYVELEVKAKPKYDSQSIISTYSNTRHLPTVLELPKPRQIKVSEKTGMPLNVLGKKQLTLAALGKHNAQYEDITEQGPESLDTTTSRWTAACSIKDKKERKQAMKEHRKERRIEKKQTKIAFAEEGQRLRQCHTRNANKGSFTMGCKNV